MLIRQYLINGVVLRSIKIKEFSLGLIEYVGILVLGSCLVLFGRAIYKAKQGKTCCCGDNKNACKTHKHYNDNEQCV